jgi:hypothetical protein
LELPQNYGKLNQKQRREVREQYIKIQEGRCCHCGQPLDGKPLRDIREMRIHKSLFPPGFFTHPVHLHHDHKTGETIGAVHNLCNAVLWQYHGK